MTHITGQTREALTELEAFFQAQHMTALSEHLAARQTVEVVAAISLFGFLGRWD